MAISPSTRVGRRKFMDRSTLGARSCARMSSLVFPAALLLLLAAPAAAPAGPPGGIAWQQVTIHERIVVRLPRMPIQIGNASGRESVCQYVSISVVAVTLKKKTTNN